MKAITYRCEGCGEGKTGEPDFTARYPGWVVLHFCEDCTVEERP